VAETKTKLSIKEAGPHRAKFFTNLEALRQKWAEKSTYINSAHLEEPVKRNALDLIKQGLGPEDAETVTETIGQANHLSSMNSRN
jgi:hypothetical protein